MEELITGLVPGLPAALRDKILDRAEGVPLYAVETVRMLLDRGLLAEDESAYRVTGEIESLEVPETLHALVAARLDALSADERRLLQHAAVLGKNFTPAAVAALLGRDQAELQPLLAGLARKEVLGQQSDPRSPEHGQYGFLQDIIRHVAYETVPKRDRRALHLAAAEHISAALAEDEVAEVVASHLLDAYRLDPDAADAASLRAQAHEALVRAGERAGSLGASTQAARYFEQAGELATDPAQQAAVLFRAGERTLNAGEIEHGRTLFERVVDLYESAGETHAAARASSWLALAEQQKGLIEQAIERMERAYEVVGEDEPDADLAFFISRLAMSHYFAGNEKRAAELTEQALDMAEALPAPRVLVRGWRLKAMLVQPTRPAEARGLFQLGLDTARAHELSNEFIVACDDLSDVGFRDDRFAESLAYLEQAMEQARRIGNRQSEWFSLSEMTYALYMLGRWDESRARFEEIPEEQLVHGNLTSPLSGLLEAQLNRGELTEARALLERYEGSAESSDVQRRAGYLAAEAVLRLAEGRPAQALSAAEQAIESAETRGLLTQDIKQAFPQAVEAALALGEREKADALLAMVECLPAGLSSPLLDATAQRFRARMATDVSEAEAGFATAIATLRKLELPFHLAVAELEYAEWLIAHGRQDEAEPLFAEAIETFARLGAAPWLERATAASPARAEASA